jgi:sugar phosphate isomerase/epimerase
MKLGLLTAPFADSALSDVADWSVANGYSMLEVACWPASGGEARRYAGTSHIDVAKLSKTRASELVGDLRGRGIEISGLGYYPNNLHPDPAHRKAVNDHLKKVITAAALLGVPVVNTFIGADQHKTQQENYRDAQKNWPALIKYAADKGVKIAIENCPMIFSNDEFPSGHNLAYTPAIWRQMFEDWGPNIGLNLDPSHLVWQMIDIERVVREFASRIFHVHGKDLEIDRDGLYNHGVLSLGMGWQIPRIPGLGEVPWNRFISALYKVGYDYVVCVEHEDRQFEGSDERIKAGFVLAKNTLQPLLVV